MEKDNPSELLYMCRMGDAHAQYRLFAQYEGLLTSLVNQTIQVYPPVKNYKDDFIAGGASWFTCSDTLLSGR